MDKCIESGVNFTYKIELNTMSEVKKFVETATKCEGKLILKSGAKLTVNAKSLLGVLLAHHLKWNDLTLVADRDRYLEFRKFVVNE
ncbi:MAG: HPr family phosphocarrier protein [Eubacteriales bacterium]|nr:HPr family phosphocarrier protein [Eubacteriales bacterium]